MAMKRLLKEYKDNQLNPEYYFSGKPRENSFFTWDFFIIGPPGTIYEGGVFDGEIIFPRDYPNSPPKVKFTSPIIHPNIYSDGNVCISILHDGDDRYNYEKRSERWNPSHSFYSIMMSIISLLNKPNFESPANIDASVLWKKDFKSFKLQIYKIISDQQNNI